MKIFKTNENGFSLVELAIAAGLAVALAATAVTVLSGTTATLSSEANVSKNSIDCYNTSALANENVTNCNTGGGTTAPAVNTGSGVTAVWDGTVLSYTVNPALCNMTSQDVSYYYNDAFGGSRLMGTTNTGSFNPTVAGYPLGGNLGYGNTIANYYVAVNCGSTSTQSGNTVS